MSHYVYLFKNQNLYFIGHSSDLNRAKKLLHPAQLITYLEQDNFQTIFKQLQSRYEEVRLPESDYFRLTKIQALECKNLIQSPQSNLALKPFFSGIRLVIAFFFFWIVLSSCIILYGINPIFQRFS